MKQPKVSEQTAQRVIRHHYGKKAGALKQLHGGLANFVFEATVNGESIVVRISDQPEKLQFFLKEQWAVTKAREKKVPTPEIFEVGNDAIGMPYMIARKMEGQPATGHPDPRTVVLEMGQYAAVINSIATQDFGHVFDWSQNRLSRNHSWKEYLRKELALRQRISFLEKQKLLPRSTGALLRKTVQSLEGWKGKPSLTHGDLRLKNLLLDAKGKICSILDWEHCSSSIGPAWEISISLHDLSIEEKHAFLEGYGISGDEYVEIAAAVKCFNILNYFVAVGEAIAQKNKEALEQVRLRLSGALDLYSL